MGFDEAFSFHERLAAPVRTQLGDGRLGVFYYAWVIPGIAIITAIGLYLLGFLRQLPRATKLRFLAAAILYIGGAIGLELLEGRHAELYGRANWAYKMMTIVEETLEVAGLIVFIWALLKFLARNYKEVRFRFEA